MPRSALLSAEDYHRHRHSDRYDTLLRTSAYPRWRSAVEATGGCAHPIRLSGQWGIQDTTTGAMLASHLGNVMVACGNRRESVCPACSDRYAVDAFPLLRAGLSGNTKGIPATVADKPRLFLTLTAPSFGPVHNRRSRNGNTCRVAAVPITTRMTPAWASR